MDSVHPGDYDGIKGLYVINLVDAVTQFEVVVAVERISEHFLIPALLKAIPDAADTLRPGLSFTALDALAHAMTDNQAAEQLNREREKLFQHIRNNKAA